jgi:hypothetical protein
MRVPERPIAPAKLLVNCSFSWSHLSIEYLDLSHVRGCLVQTEREVETLGVVVATSVLDGEGVASEPLHRVLLRVILGNFQRLEFLWEEEVAKSRREGGEAVVVT